MLIALDFPVPRSNVRIFRSVRTVLSKGMRFADSAKSENPARLPWEFAMVISKHSDSDLGMRGRLIADGFLVTRVIDGSSADLAGLERGDVIYSIMGHPVCSREIWQRLLSGDNGYLQLSVMNRRTHAHATHYCCHHERRK